MESVGFTVAAIYDRESECDAHQTPLQDTLNSSPKSVRRPYVNRVSPGWESPRRLLICRGSIPSKQELSADPVPQRDQRQMAWHRSALLPFLKRPQRHSQP